MIKSISVKARIINKRSCVAGYNSVYTLYYVTFQTDDDMRLEFAVEGSISGKLLEGDYGILLYSKDKFIRFDVIGSNYRDEVGNTVLHNAVRDNNIKEAKIFLENGANVNAINNFGISPLLFAIENNNITMVELLIENGCNCNIKGDKNHFPLFIAFYNQNLNMAKLLIENGMELNVTTLRGETPLHFAVYLKKIEFIKWLIKSGADVNLGKDTLVGPPIISVFHKSFTENVVKKILEEVKKDIKSDISISKKDSIWFVYRYHPDAEIIKLLIESGADITVKDQLGNTAIGCFNDFKRNILNKIEEQFD